MNVEEFRRTLSAPAPPSGLDLALQALWWAGRNEWDSAHGCVQQREGEPACDWVHAYLHRLEGDASNAAYWYRRAGRKPASLPSEAEWTAILTELLQN